VGEVAEIALILSLGAIALQRIILIRTQVSPKKNHPTTIPKVKKRMTNAVLATLSIVNGKPFFTCLFYLRNLLIRSQA
jgi:hypothetical protein